MHFSKLEWSGKSVINYRTGMFLRLVYTKLSPQGETAL